VNSGYDAAELLAAGADAVQVGTATFVDPRAPLRVLEELKAWCSSQGIANISALAGGQAIARSTPSAPG
jgi:dihydroorotate dehydrogenase (NAD+) catalytic subunit